MLTAATLKSYSVPFNNPETMQCIGALDGNITAGTVVATVHGPGGVPLSRYCTVYDVIEVPPSSDGVFHVKDTDLKPGSAVNAIGCVGNPCVFAETILEYGPTPTAFVAATLKSYDVPSCNPETTQNGVEPDTEELNVLHGVVPLTLYCTLYTVIGVPPSFNGLSHVKDTLFKPDVATKLVGASGSA